MIVAQALAPSRADRRVADGGRVIAGTARGCRLVAPPAAVRPLGDRLKQALFATLEPRLPGASFLDLCAGSGAGGIEALSRGASSATFVEREDGALRTIRANLDRTGLAGPNARVVRADALAWLRGPGSRRAPLAAEPAAGIPFDIVLVDPPYAEVELLRQLLDVLADPAGGRLAPGAAVIAKHFWKDRPPGRTGLLGSDRDRRFGETGLTFYRWEGG